jgi:hypothetical protein
MQYYILNNYTMISLFELQIFSYSYDEFYLNKKEVQYFKNFMKFEFIFSIYLNIYT